MPSSQSNPSPLNTSIKGAKKRSHPQTPKEAVEHPDTPMAMGNLAFTLKSQSHNQEAMSLIETCSQMRKQILGPDHPDRVFT